ncbi:MAG: hypothetical protein D6738_06280 [Acidobacteria bacterium]|nr:MAG: hypothetical protein D6738_06280 [Acidobacteriota bacterium]
MGPDTRQPGAPDPQRPLRRVLEMLDARLAVLTDGAELVARIDAELGRFVRDDLPDATPFEVRFKPGPPRAAVHGETFVLDPGAAVDQAFGRLFRAALDETTRHLVLHAAALERDGRALLVAGPSHSGKTTLALALVRAGFRLLSDDFTPIERRRGVVVPFLKALGIRHGPGRRLAALAPHADAADRVAVDAGALPDGSLADAPAPPGAIVLCDGGEAPPDPTAAYPFSVVTTGPVERLATRLALPGVTVRGTAPGELSLMLDPMRIDAHALDEVLESDPHVLEYGVAPRSLVRRAGDGRLLPLRGRDALLLLLRDLQNRRRGGALVASLGGDPARLALELARVIGRCPCAFLVAGEPEPTAERLRAWFDQLPAGAAPSGRSGAAPGSTSSR